VPSIPVEPSQASHVSHAQQQEEEENKSEPSDTILKNVEQVFWQKFSELERLDTGIVEHKQLQDSLVSTGKFYAGDAHYLSKRCSSQARLLKLIFIDTDERKEKDLLGDELL
jgi:hypothetical protein